MMVRIFEVPARKLSLEINMTTIEYYYILFVAVLIVLLMMKEKNRR